MKKEMAITLFVREDNIRNLRYLAYDSLPSGFTSPHLISQQCYELDRAASIEILPTERVRLREVK